MTKTGTRKESRTRKKPDAQVESTVSNQPERVGDEGVDRIRDILFGAQIGEYDRRFQQIQNTLDELAAGLKADLKQNFATLHSLVEKHVSEISEELEKAKTTQNTAVQRLAVAQSALEKSFETQLKNLQGELEKATQGLDRQLQNKDEALNRELQRKYEELSGLLNTRFQELSSAKADRSTLASLLTELAGSLNPEPKAPRDK